MKTHAWKFTTEQLQQGGRPFSGQVEGAIQQANFMDAFIGEELQLPANLFDPFAAYFCPTAGAIEATMGAAASGFHLYKGCVRIEK